MSDTREAGTSAGAPERPDLEGMLRHHESEHYEPRYNPSYAIQYALYLESRLKELEADKARLDWIEANAGRGGKYGGCLVTLSYGLYEVGETSSAGFNGMNDGEGKTLREAIDAAMKGESE